MSLILVLRSKPNTCHIWILSITENQLTVPFEVFIFQFIVVQLATFALINISWLSGTDCILIIFEVRYFIFDSSI